MNPITDIISSALAPALGIIDKFVPDKDQAAQLKFQISNSLIGLDAKILESQTKAIVAEAQGESWMQRNWRPTTMLTFTGLIVAHWLGFTPENLPETEVMALLEIVKIGLAGYVVGRSAEKFAKNWKPNG